MYMILETKSVLGSRLFATRHCHALPSQYNGDHPSKTSFQPGHGEVPETKDKDVVAGVNVTLLNIPARSILDTYTRTLFGQDDGRSDL
jgi:hypothetical protein